MKNKKKIILLSSLLLCGMLGLGWGKKPVELLNENPPLIDLGEAIVEAQFGKNGNTSAGETEPLSQGKTLVISVRDEVITYDGKIYAGVELLKKRIDAGYKTGDLVHLVDNYAEAHRYREVLAILKELEEEKGISYTAD